jgi:TatD DNase family protein
MLIDSHCHLDRLDLTPYGGDFSRWYEAALAHGVHHMLCVSINMQRYPAMLALVEPYPAISVSVGVHPNETDEVEVSLDTLVQLAAHERVVAIGETGLDYYRTEGEQGWQHERFRTHIHAALVTRKPLIVHTREARQDTLAILEQEQAREVGGVIHCFTEDWDTACRAMDQNFYVSFSGIVTFRNADELRDVARRMPADRYLIETDAPYLAPVPYRGKPNYPHYVSHVAACMAELRGISIEQVREESAANYHALFG